MPLLIDNERITVNQIRGYSGPDEIMNLFKKGLLEIEKKFFNKKKPLIFRYRPGMIKTNSAGAKEGKKAIRVVWSDIKNTETGSATVTYCELIINNPNGNVEYKPRGEWIRKKRILNQNETELALYYYCISSTMMEGGNRFVVEDLEKADDQLMKKREENSSLDFYVYNPDSELYNDSDKLRRLAYSWGVGHADTMAISTVKNKLYAAVKNAKQPELKIQAFVKAIKEKTPFSLALGSIQKARDTNTLHFDKYQWFIKAGDGAKSNILTISPDDNKRAVLMLAFEIMSKPEKYERIKALYGAATPDLTEEMIDALTGPNLIAECKEREIKTSGIKHLILKEKLKAAIAVQD